MPKKIQNDLGQMFSFKHSLPDNTHSKQILSSAQHTSGPLEKTKRPKEKEKEKPQIFV